MFSRRWIVMNLCQHGLQGRLCELLVRSMWVDSPQGKPCCQIFTTNITIAAVLKLAELQHDILAAERTCWPNNRDIQPLCSALAHFFPAKALQRFLCYTCMLMNYINILLRHSSSKNLCNFCAPGSQRGLCRGLGPKQHSNQAGMLVSILKSCISIFYGKKVEKIGPFRTSLPTRPPPKKLCRNVSININASEI